MEVFFRPSANLEFKLDVKNLEELFQELSPIQEVMQENCVCGKCKSEKIRFVHRTADKFDFYEMRCMTCGAKLAIGKNNEGHLFPRKYEQDPTDPKKPLQKDGKTVYLPNNGWVKYNTKTGKNE